MSVTLWEVARFWTVTAKSRSLVWRFSPTGRSAVTLATKLWMITTGRPYRISSVRTMFGTLSGTDRSAWTMSLSVPLRHRWSLARLSALVKPHAVVELSYSALNTGHSSGEPENDGSWLPCVWRAMYWVNAACSAGRGCRTLLNVSASRVRASSVSRKNAFRYITHDINDNCTCFF